MAQRRGGLDTREAQIGQTQEHIMAATGDIDRSEFQEEFESVDTPNWKAIEHEAFMHEMVEVVILEDHRPNAEQFIQTAVNGVNQFFERGVPLFVKRMFVEVLARARPFNIATPEYVDSTGAKATKIVKTYGLQYPFSVLGDPNPNGRRWLESVLREA